MKYFIAISLLVTTLSCFNSTTKSGNSGAPGNSESMDYPLAVSFGSICCGTPSSDFLKNFVQGFNQKYRSKISADIAAGCGREGEFVILFKVPEDESLHQKFEKELKVLVEKTDAQNKKSNASSGGLELLQNAGAADYKNCRLGIKAWDIK